LFGFFQKKENLLDADVDAVLHELGVAARLDDVDLSGRGPLGSIL
jgi:hypothetical protein